MSSPITPVMTLRQKQAAFAVCVAKLILFIDKKGWEVTLAEGYIGDSIDKPSEDTPHLRTGTHFLRLGQDINLFVAGKWISKLAPEWQELGKFWKSLHPLARWGGDFRSLDLNHFSFAHGGVA